MSFRILTLQRAVLSSAVCSKTFMAFIYIIVFCSFSLFVLVSLSYPILMHDLIQIASRKPPACGFGAGGQPYKGRPFYVTSSSISLYRVNCHRFCSAGEGECSRDRSVLCGHPLTVRERGARRRAPLV